MGFFLLLNRSTAYSDILLWSLYIRERRGGDAHNKPVSAFFLKFFFLRNVLKVAPSPPLYNTTPMSYISPLHLRGEVKQKSLSDMTSSAALPTTATSALAK